MSVVTRFAPSPTGFLHIGGARTALFNWLFSQHHALHGDGGTFLLRIEDTDRKRSTQDAVDAIFDGLRWLGLTWDGDAISQFGRIDQHRAVVERLLDDGRAYRCYCSPEELGAMREEARTAGRKRMYDGRWRDRDPADATKKRYWLRYRCRWDAALARFAERGESATQTPRDAPPCRSGCAVVCDVAVDTGRGYAVLRDRAAAPPLKLVAKNGGREQLADGDIIRVQSGPVWKATSDVGRPKFDFHTGQKARTSRRRGRAGSRGARVKVRSRGRRSSSC